jgi:ribonuclease HI
MSNTSFDLLLNKSDESKKDDIFDPDYYVYTDGACLNNGTEHAIAGIGIYFGENDVRNVSHKIIGKQSNNTAELTAIIEAYTIIEKDLLTGKKVCVVSDSLYAIRSATTYGEKCSNDGWKKDIPNKELVMKAFNCYHNNPHVKLIHIVAHTTKTDIHSLGNNGADKLANKAIGLEECPYSTLHNKIYIAVPLTQKEVIKKLGGGWDPIVKYWYIFDNSINKEEVLKLFKQIDITENKYPSRMGQPWKDDEILKLLTSIQKKKSIELIATEHERTVSSIIAYIRKLAVDYHFNDNRPIEEIQKFTGLSKEQIEDAIKKHEFKEAMQKLNKSKEPIKIKKEKLETEDLPTMTEVLLLLKDIQKKLDMLLEKA